MNPSLRQKCILWGSAGGSGLLLMGCVVILYAQCRPTWVMWTPAAKIQDGVAHCWPTDILVDYSIVVGGALSCGRLTCMLALKLTNLTMAAIAAAVDAYLAVYPAVIIWRLHMSIKKKIGLSLALGLGAG